MSFIYGIINQNGEKVSNEQIDNLANAVSYESFEIKYIVDDNCAFGFCFKKEAINKASIYNSDEVLVISDAFIYDYFSDGHTTDTPSEFSNVIKHERSTVLTAEMIAKNYCQEKSIQWITHLDGEFAIVVYDKKTNDIFLIKDHMGFRPLSYKINASKSQISFASKSRALLNSDSNKHRSELTIHQNELLKCKKELSKYRNEKADIRSQLSESKIIKSLLFTYKSDYEQTLFKNIKNVLPGHVIKIRKGVIKKSKYWSLKGIKEDKTITAEQAVAQIKLSLEKAIKVRLEDGNIGVHLSGGLDSSGIAALLVDNCRDRTHLFSWSPAEQDYNEILRKIFPNSKVSYVQDYNSKKAKESDKDTKNIDNNTKCLDKKNNDNELDEICLINDFCEKKQCEAHRVKVDSELFRKYIETDDYSEIPVNYYFEKIILNEAYKKKVTQIFSGWGGDECVSLSNRGALSHLFWTMNYAELKKWIKKNGIISTINVLKRELLPIIFHDNNIKKDLKSIKIFRPKYRILALYYILKSGFGHLYGFGNRKAIVLKMLESYHLQVRIDFWAQFSEEFGITYKYPLLDKKLIEYFLSIPSNLTYNVNEPRKLFRSSLQGVLPDQIRLRENKSEKHYKQFAFITRQLKLENAISYIPNDDYNSQRETLNKSYIIDEIVSQDKILQNSNNQKTNLRDYNSKIILKLNYIRIKLFENKVIKSKPF